MGGVRACMISPDATCRMLANPSRATCTSYAAEGRRPGRPCPGRRARVVEVALLELPAPLRVEGGERVVQDALPDLAHEPVVEVQVVLPQQLPAQRLVRLRQVVEIGARVVLAGRAGAARVERLVRVLVHAPAQLQVAPRGEDPAALAEGRRQDAVEHVEAAVHGLEQVERRADAHQVARPVPRHSRGGLLADVLPLVAPLAHGQSADGQAVEGHARQAARRSRGAGPRRARPARCRTATGASRLAPSRLRTAQRCVRSRAARAEARSATALTHWSSAIMMSLPMATCVPIDSSGLSSTAFPST